MLTNIINLDIAWRSFKSTHPIDASLEQIEDKMNEFAGDVERAASVNMHRTSKATATGHHISDTDT